MIHTGRLTLRPPRTGDLSAFVELWTDAEVARNMDEFGPRRAAEVPGWLQGTIAEEGSATSLQLAIEHTEDAQVVGWLGLGLSNRGVASWDLGYAIRSRFRGRGFASEALRAALRYCADELTVPGLWGECHSGNAASARVMLAAGMHEIAPGDDGQRRFVYTPDALGSSSPGS